MTCDLPASKALMQWATAAAKVWQLSCGTRGTCRQPVISVSEVGSADRTNNMEKDSCCATCCLHTLALRVTVPLINSRSRLIMGSKRHCRLSFSGNLASAAGWLLLPYCNTFGTLGQSQCLSPGDSCHDLVYTWLGMHFMYFSYEKSL